MPCPLHHFVSVPHCAWCNAFGGGFVTGFIFYPVTLYKGKYQFTPDMAKKTGRQIRTMAHLVRKYPANKESVEAASEVYKQLPQEAQEGLQLGASQQGGRLMGGMMASQLVAAGLGRLVSCLVVGALGPRGTIHAPHWNRLTVILSGAYLSYYSILGSTVRWAERQRQIYDSFPGTEEAVNKVMSDVLDKEKGQK
jgi:hypothetical protein